MSPGARTMPIVVATWLPAEQRWSLTLPSGEIKTFGRAYLVERFVKRELPGTVLRFKDEAEG